MAKPVGKPRQGREKKPRAEPRGKDQRAALPVPRGPAFSPSPFTLMRRLTEEMDRLFEGFRLGSVPVPRFGLPWDRETGEGAWLPSLEVVERGGKLVVRADLPGLRKEDVKVELRDDVLCIEGERRQEREEKRKGVYRSERSYGRFYREIPLPEGIDPEQAKASFKNGVLEVTMPSPPRPARGRQVPIEES